MRNVLKGFGLGLLIVILGVLVTLAVRPDYSHAQDPGPHDVRCAVKLIGVPGEALTWITVVATDSQAQAMQKVCDQGRLLVTVPSASD